jgi:hypothetical protein
MYPAALFQLFTGLYVLQLCLIGLFALSQNVHGTQGCIPQAVMMAFAFGCTAVYHRKLVEIYSPFFSGKLMDDLPDEEMQPPVRQTKGEAAYQVKNPIRHPALIAKRPIVWIPQDRLGISDGEISETIEMYGGTIPISNKDAALDDKGRVVCESLAPPCQD